MKSTELREKWKQFWETEAPSERRHTWADPASLIVRSADDPTTMFNTAGMQQFVPYLMGKEHPDGRRLYNIQGCVRTTDIEEVGDVSHLTFFEMMGNWSLGDYFKKETIAWSWKFLTDKTWLGLDPNYLAVTVFAGDDDAPKDAESVEFWKKQGVPEERIAYLGKKDNWRGPAGATGPCGPDTEIFYRIGEGEPPKVHDPVKDEDNWLEIWNDVFMAYYKDKEGAYSELEQKNVDTGMGFERMCMVLQCVDGTIKKPIRNASIYETDLFAGIMSHLSEVTNNEKKRRIMADHVRTSFQLIQEGLVPSNEGRGYVLRRLIRRMYFQYYSSVDALPTETKFQAIQELLSGVKDELNKVYQDKFTEQTAEHIFREIKQFDETIHHGEKLLQEMMAGLQLKKGAVFPGDKAFKLYDTYGFPVELTEEILAEKEITLDKAGFKHAMEAAKEQSRKGSQDKFSKDIDWAAHIDDLPPTQFVGYEHLAADVQILKDFEVDGQRVLVFDKTPFYAESGGQTGDQGKVELDEETIYIRDVQKYGGVWLHFVS